VTTLAQAQEIIGRIVETNKATGDAGKPAIQANQILPFSLTFSVICTVLL
jgi:hypothetical protein